MKKANRILAFFLAFSLLLGLCTWGGAETSEQDEPVKFAEAIDLFGHLIINGQSILSAIGGELNETTSYNDAVAFASALHTPDRPLTPVARDYPITGEAFFALLDALVCTSEYFPQARQYNAYLNGYLAGFDESYASLAARTITREEAAQILMNALCADVRFGETWKLYEEFGLSPEYCTDEDKTDPWGRPLRRWLQNGSPITDWHVMPALYSGNAMITTHELLERLGVLDWSQDDGGFSSNQWCIFNVCENGGDYWSANKLHWGHQDGSGCHTDFLTRRPGSKMEVYELDKQTVFVQDAGSEQKCRVFRAVVIDTLLAKITDQKIAIYANPGETWKWSDDRFPEENGYYLVNVSLKAPATAYPVGPAVLYESPQRGMDLPSQTDGRYYVFTDLAMEELSYRCSLGYNEIIGSMDYYNTKPVYFFRDDSGYIIGAIDPDELSPAADPQYFAAQCSTDTLSVSSCDAEPARLTVRFGADLPSAKKNASSGVLLTAVVKSGNTVVRTVANKLPAAYRDNTVAEAVLAWDGKDDSGSFVRQGSYTLELTAEYHLDSSPELKPYAVKTASFPISFTPPILSFGIDGTVFRAQLNVTGSYKAILASYMKNGRFESFASKTGSDAELTFSVPFANDRTYKLILMTEDNQPIDTKTVSLDLPTVAPELLTAAQQKTLCEPKTAEKPVIFIRDGGVGDGSSADSPLSLTDSGNVLDVDPATGESPERQYNSLLYQAAAQLYGTGGTIVVCGEVLCDGDDGRGINEFHELILPHLGGAGITITSVYDGVDYQKTSGARLILQSPLLISCCNPVTFRDMTICTMATSSQDASGRSIAGCGFPLVFDTGITCKVLDANKNEVANPSASQFLSVYGGHRYVMQERSTDVTLRSGTFYKVCAGNCGVSLADYGQLYGDSHLTIEGTATVRGLISGTTSDNRGVQDGNCYITINGGNIQGSVQMSSTAGFAGGNCREYLTVTGGTFAAGTRFNALAMGSYYGKKPAASYFDCSLAPDSAALVSKAVGFTEIAVNPNVVTGGTITAAPCRTAYFAGDAFDPSGLTVSLSTASGAKTVSFRREISAFRFVSDGVTLSTGSGCMTTGMHEVAVYYGAALLGSVNVTVEDRPRIAILGSFVSGSGEKKDLHFAFGVESTELAPPILDCGIKYYPAECVHSPSELYDGSLAGALSVSADRNDQVTSAAFPAGTLSAAVPSVPIEEYGRAYTAVAYYTLLCGEETLTVYSDAYTASVYDTAKTAGNTQITALADSGARSSRDDALIAEKIGIVTDYMEQMAWLPWHCNTEIDFRPISHETGGVTQNLYYHAGETYYGIPYIGGYTGGNNLEQFAGALDENGTYSGPTAYTTMQGNNCTSAIFQAMSRASNLYDYWLHLGDPVLNIVPRMQNGDAPVRIVGNLNVRPTDALTTLIIQRNSSSAVYEAYAKLQEGDFLFCHVNSPNNVPWSHLRLVRGVSVVRNSDGSIDPTASYVYYAEQTAYMNDQWHTTWGTRTATTFWTVMNEWYVPVRNASFESGYFETPYCVVRDANTPQNIAQGVCGTVESNYDLSEVRLTILDAESGEVVFENCGYGYLNRKCCLAKLDPDNVVKTLARQGGYEYVLTVGTANTTREYIRFNF